MYLLLKQAGVILLGVMLLYSPAWAMDYTTLSNDELYELKGAVKNAPETEQEAYQKEWQLRVSKMTKEEVERYSADPGENEGDDGKAGVGAKAPFIQGKGYDRQGMGTVIFGGMPSAKGESKSGGGQGR